MAHLKILVLEDNETDAELLLSVLKKAGFVFISEIVSSKETFENALDHFKPDIILSDYNLPSFDGAAAFSMKENKCPHLPFIIVSGYLGEEKAVELIKNGVTDFTLKDNLFTLPNKINRALAEVKIKKESDERFSYATRASNDIIYDWKIIDDVIWWNDAYYTFMGIQKETEWLNLNSWTDFIHPEDQERIVDNITNFLESDKNFWSDEYRFLDNQGRIYYLVDRGYLIRDSEGKPLKMIGAVNDITSLKENIIHLEQILFSVSHEVRRPIATILGVSNYLDEEVPTADEIKMLVHSIKDSALSLDMFTQELTSFVSEFKDNSKIN